MYALAPSILAADFARLGEQVEQIESAGGNMLHIDVMDGVFVPSISFGFPIIRSIRKKSKMFFDVHLMITAPERYVEEFAEAGADGLTIHVEACQCMVDTLEKIRSLGMQPGVSLHPQTPVSAVYPYLDKVDRVLVMTVNTGFGGQQYIEGCTKKITMLRDEIKRRNLPVDVEVDGGVNRDNMDKILEAGANILVSGSSVFKGDLAANMHYFLDGMKKYEEA
ncbi:MAG: ribulose-phosphate 3-epimerase [Lachnospiraceae bacterium]|nr:ribulose-phosphate 3-epimerase [Lachnospiraceae bacterium]